MTIHSEELSPINQYLKRQWGRVGSTPRRLGNRLSPQLFYLVAASLVLVATTVLWAVLSARVELYNADQLADPYLFTDAATFHGATFPSAHTFLLKWPVFWLVGLVGVSGTSLLVATVGVSLATVLMLAYVLYRIERRPLVLATLYLALALVLLLVPPQSYAGALLPLNMGMLATRNLEYVWYLGALVLFVKASGLRNWRFWLGVLVLAILIASDRLFTALSMGGASLALLVYALRGNWPMVSVAARWTIGSLAAVIGALLCTTLISGLHVTHLSNGGAVSPYGVGGGVKDVLLGMIYGTLGFFSNLGANPAYANRTLGSLPHEFLTGMLSLRGALTAITFAVVCICIAAVWYVGYPSIRRRAQPREADAPTKLSLTLVWSTIAAAGVFVASQHYYAVDARYLAIGVFALFVSLATALRTSSADRPNVWMGMGVVLLAATAAACWVARGTANQQIVAMGTYTTRNATVVQMLKGHDVDVLVGDYWRVLPIRQAAQGSLRVQPMASCTAPATALTSTAWQPDLSRHSFAYLISFDTGLTGYTGCTLAQISRAYGRPNAVQVVAGTLAAPQEALLFYDHGSHPSAATSPAGATPLLPVGIDQLATTTCSGATVMNVVAHQDDDILFMNPDLLHDLHIGNCLRTVFLTAGDSGYGKFYWLSRQLGAEAAYSSMLGIKDAWDQQAVTLPGGQYVTIATPRSSTQVSLIFLNLPDGNIHGDGFTDNHHESLFRLYAGAVPVLHAVDGQSSYTSDQLTGALVNLMDTYQPAALRTQADVSSEAYPDHSDHITAGLFAARAATVYSQQHLSGGTTIPIGYYVGYPIHGYDANVGGDDLAQKEAAFFAYAKYDNSVCGSIERCAQVPAYDAYLQRQYRTAE